MKGSKLLSLPLAVALMLISNATVIAAGDALVNVGSPPGFFPQNKQNEPALAVDANHPNVLAAGSNDEIDLSACYGSNCSFTAGVGVSGIYFSTDSGKSWIQPTYSGWSARACKGVTPCTPGVGPIGTVPNYYEAGLVSGGDPAVAFGPRMAAGGKFSWAAGSRLYYANLASNFSNVRTDAAFAGYEAVAVSSTDDVTAAAAGVQAAWTRPVIVSQQSQTTFSDKEQIWADNAASSPYFGNVYVCWANFTSNAASPAPLKAAVSSDGGATWTEHQLSSAANNSQNSPPDGCTVRTDSRGNAYVFGVATDNSGSFEVMSVSTDGGKSWSKPGPVAGPVTQPGIFDPVTGRPEIDGIGGARSDLAPAPSVDIANGAPTGAHATDRIVMSYVSGEIIKPHVYFTDSANGGATWSTPRAVEGAADRGYYTAPAISPTGSEAWLVYSAFTTPYQTDTSSPRALVGVVLHGKLAKGGGWTFSEAYRGPVGDPRGSSQNNLRAEFLGDYVYAIATPAYGAAVWTDARNATDCPAVDQWRMSLQTTSPGAKPAPLQVCPSGFGNSDIYSWTSAN